MKNPEIDTESDIIVDLQNGSELAFRQVIQKYQDMLKRYVACFLYSPDVVHEIVHDSFVQFWHNYVQKPKPIFHLRSLLLRIARNRAIDHLRKEKAWNLLLLNVSWKKQTQTPLHLVQSEELNAILKEKYFELSPKDREILLLVYSERMRMSEIAQVLSISEEAVSSRLRRARRRLKELLPNSFYQEWSVVHNNVQAC